MLLMSSVKKYILRIIIVFLTSISSLFLVSGYCLASQVQVCKKVKQSLQVKNPSPKKVYCTVKHATGRIGDFVEIKNKYNYIVATGRIIKRGRSSSIVVLNTYRKDLGSMAGFPVLLRDEGNQDYWTATTAPF